MVYGCHKRSANKTCDSAASASDAIGGDRESSKSARFVFALDSNYSRRCIRSEIFEEVKGGPMQVSIGSVLTYQAKNLSTTSDTPNANDAVSEISAYLSASALDVIDYNLTVPSIGAEIANSAGGLFTYNFQMILKVKTRVTDYADENDVKSLIDAAVIAILNQNPVSVITQVQAPSGTTTETAPPQTGISGGVAGTTTTSSTKDSSTSSFFDSFSTFLKGAGVGGFLGIGLALVAVVLLVSLATSKKIIPGA